MATDDRQSVYLLSLDRSLKVHSFPDGAQFDSFTTPKRENLVIVVCCRAKSEIGH